jgi:translation initiation factor IF-1
MVQFEIVEIEGTIIEHVSNRKYLVRIDYGELKNQSIEVLQGAASYYDGILFYKGDKVIIDYRRSAPEKSVITYRIKK